MIVNKKALILKEILEDENFNISHLKITEKETIATNGKILLQLKNPSQELLQDFPQIEGLNSTKNEVYVNKETISKIEKNIPKKPSIPILENFVIGEDEEKILIFLSDLENDIKITQRKPEIDYPENLEQFYPKEFKFKITLNYSLLKQLVKVVEKLSKDKVGITFSFTDDNTKPIKIEFNESDVNLKGLILPMKVREEV